MVAEKDGGTTPSTNGLVSDIMSRFVQLADGDLLVSHVMRLREMHRADSTKVMRWHEP